MRPLAPVLRPTLGRPVVLGGGGGAVLRPLFDRVHQALFGAGEQGIYMPSVHESFLRGDLYQDAAGTTPAVLGQPVGLWLDRSKGLELGLELLENGDFSDGTTGWTADDATLSVVGTGLRVVTIGDYGRAIQGISLVAGKSYVYEADIEWVSGNTQNTIQITSNPNGGGAPLAADAGVGSRHARLVYTAASTGVVYVTLQNNSGQPSTHDFSNATFRELPGNHASQSTAASRPTLVQDDNGIYCLRFDGTDDWMVTPSIDFTSTDKMTAVGGYRRSPDSPPSTGHIAWELGPTYADEGVAAERMVNSFGRAVAYINGGSAVVETSEGETPAGAKYTTATSFDIGGNTPESQIPLRRYNGAPILGRSGTATSRGGFLDARLRIGARINDALTTAADRMHGDIYGLIVCGAAKSLAQIEAAERLINRYTRAF